MGGIGRGSSTAAAGEAGPPEQRGGDGTDMHGRQSREAGYRVLQVVQVVTGMAQVVRAAMPGGEGVEPFLGGASSTGVAPVIITF